MARLNLFIAAGIVILPGMAWADCNTATSDRERAQCVGDELRDADATINSIYGQLRAKLTPDGQRDLRRQEVAWIKTRAETCHVDTKEAARDKWIASLLADYSKTVCVVGFTQRRIAELQSQLAALQQASPGGPAALPPAAAPAPAPPAASSDTPQEAGAAPSSLDVYKVVTHHRVTSGKWYFEMAFDRGAIAKDASADIFAGVAGAGVGAIGTLQTIHHRDAGRPKINIGVALDLDAGKVYLRFNGAWPASPGSAGGIDIKLGRTYLGLVNSSIPMGAYLKNDAVSVNFGEHGFVYTLPDGYTPMDTQPPLQLPE